jgi:hypothetical protein
VPLLADFGPKQSLITILFALIVMVMVPAQALGMELKVVGNQLILSGSVVGDEPGKVRTRSSAHQASRP